ncbi:hypothetical protein H0H93_016752 [Arthromyces matolae]|nr:hypothetical protein H0H93_016752 [Arthromyces matolae]
MMSLSVNILVSVSLFTDTSLGFPAADHEVRSYLAYGKESYHSFLYALFEVLQETLDEKVGEERIHWTFAEKLRYLMTHEQRYSEQGTLRTEFYDKVIKKAKTLREKPVVYDDLYIKANALVSSLPFSDEIPLVLAIDEAHCLATDISGVEAELINLRRQLSKIVICSRIITVLISTSGEIQKFRPPQALSPGPTARRLIRGHQVLPPFTAIGFDHFARGMVKENFLMLDEIITDRFMCQFGRPLFGSRYNNGTYPIQQDIVRYAAQKLRGGGVMPRELSFSAMLACLASRLALQFNPTSLNQQLQQVEQHLRLCITMTADMETAITVAASEPIVAEGSAYMLCHFREQKKMPQMLREVLLGTPSIDLGHRGETMGLLLLTMARDEIVYPPEDPYLSLNNPEGPELRSIPLVTFIQTLLVVDNLTEALPTSVADPTKNLPFGETFRNSRIHFNHFIKVTDSKTINRHYLWKVATRGAGILCADRQLGIDAILIFILDCKKPLGPDNIGVLLIQDKNDAGFELPYNDYLNDVMNPYDLGIFDNDKDQCYVPLIRMVFALASSKSGAYAIKPPMDRPRRETTGTSTPKQMYTAYDFWCAGATRDTFPLIGDDERVFRDILHRDPFWPASYKPLNGEPMEIEAVKRSLHPASRADNGHWSFCEDLRMLASAEDTATEILDMPDTAADEDSSVPQGKKKRKRTAKKRQRLN